MNTLEVESLLKKLKIHDPTKTGSYKPSPFNVTVTHPLLQRLLPHFCGTPLWTQVKTNPTSEKCPSCGTVFFFFFFTKMMLGRGITVVRWWWQWFWAESDLGFLETEGLRSESCSIELTKVSASLEGGGAAVRGDGCNGEIQWILFWIWESNGFGLGLGFGSGSLLGGIISYFFGFREQFR